MQFNATTLATDPVARARYLRYVMYYEGLFGDLGTNNKTGLTLDGTGVDYKTGLPDEHLHYWTAASKEALHMMLLARALEGEEYSRMFFAEGGKLSAVQVEEKVLSLMEAKMDSLESWNEQYPGFGGYLPWVNNAGPKVLPLPEWKSAVPSLDNGEMVWALYACEVVCSMRNGDARAQAIAARMKTYLKLLAKTAPVMFYAGKGKVRTVATIKDVHAQPTDPNNYFMDCDETKNNCYLDDPYEGELFTVFMDLYSPWESETERESIWLDKRHKLEAVDYPTPSGPITVQRGWWFSSHEQWKYLQMPYLSASPTNRRVFMNGERARTHNSALLKIPGLYASITDTCRPGEQPARYLSATGIAPISFQEVIHKHVITPYGAYPVMIADLGVGLAWYNNMLQGPSMQGPYGSTEAVHVDGTEIAPVVTWDSKITNVVAMVGGTADLVQIGMLRDNTFARFASKIEGEWGRVFKSLKGEHIPFALPSVPVPRTPKLGDFNTCPAQLTK